MSSPPEFLILYAFAAIMLFRLATVARCCALLEAFHSAALLNMASVSDHGHEWNTEKAFSKNVADLHAVELLRTGPRQEPLHPGSQRLLSTPWGHDGSQFIGQEEEIPSGIPKLPIEPCAFVCSQRAPLIAVVFALHPDRTQKRRLLDEDGSGLNRVRDRAAFHFVRRAIVRDILRRTTQRPDRS
jgi:hypothetical protein